MASKALTNGRVVEWIPQDEACERLGKSSKTLERLTLTKDIATKMEPVEGRKPRRVFYAPHVEKVASAFSAKRKVRVANALSPPSALISTAQATEAIHLLVQTLREHTTIPKPSPATLQLWLTIEQAAEYSGLSRADLKGLAASGALQSRKSGRGLRIRRVSLDNYNGD